MSKEQLEALLEDPNARAMLDLIARAEGTYGKGDNGYDVAFNNGKVSSYDSHPNVARSFKQTNGKRNKTTAAGRYQFINSTYKHHAEKLGLEDFSPRNQDIAALSIIKDSGALDDVLSGDLSTAVAKLGKQWASLPSSNYPQPKRTYAELGLSGKDDLSKNLMPPESIRQLPTTVVNRGGVQMVAVPEFMSEQRLMDAWDAMYPEGTQQGLVRMLSMINSAKKTSSEPLFSPQLPNDLDDDLIELIRSTTVDGDTGTLSGNLSKGS